MNTKPTTAATNRKKSTSRKNNNSDYSERRTLNLELEKNSRNVVTWMRWILFGMLSLGYFYYSTLNEMNSHMKDLTIIVDKQQASIDNMTDKIETIITSERIYQRNIKAFNVSESSKICAQCHLTPSMFLFKSNMDLSTFKKYVRGNNRHITNKSMPAFTDKMISDDNLEEIYMILKYPFNRSN